MKVRHHKISVVILEVCRCNRQHQAGKSTQREEDQETDAKQHRRLEAKRPAPHGRNPVKYLHACRNGDEHGGVHKEQLSRDRHTHGVHVMRPDDKGQKGNRCRGIDHRGVAKQRLSGKGRNDLRHHTKGRQNNDVNLGVTKEPEDVLEQYGVAATGRGKEAGAEMDIH